MTIKQFVETQPIMGINDWIELIKKNKFEQYESIILSCADEMNKIKINHEANFIKAINL